MSNMQDTIFFSLKYLKKGLHFVPDKLQATSTTKLSSLHRHRSKCGMCIFFSPFVFSFLFFSFQTRSAVSLSAHRRAQSSRVSLKRNYNQSSAETRSRSPRFVCVFSAFSRFPFFFHTQPRRDTDRASEIHPPIRQIRGGNSKRAA